MQNVEEQKVKLEQKKNRLIQEEVRLKIKERKVRTRHLIEIGGLIVKAELGSLPTNTLYGALLSLTKSLSANSKIQHEWTTIGKNKLDREKLEKTAIILKFDEQPDSDIRSLIRNHGLKWNRFRSEWYGDIIDLKSLKESLGSIKCDIEIIDTV
jgi:hypothetical protein